MQKKTWMVRVYRRVEDVLAIQADTAAQAEDLAAARPGVITVLSHMTISGDKPAGMQVPHQGVEDVGDE